MPNHQQITAAREKAKRIREYAVAFRQESAQMAESINDNHKSAGPVVISCRSSKAEAIRVVGRVA